MARGVLQQILHQPPQTPLVPFHPALVVDLGIVVQAVACRAVDGRARKRAEIDRFRKARCNALLANECKQIADRRRRFDGRRGDAGERGVARRVIGAACALRHRRDARERRAQFVRRFRREARLALARGDERAHRDGGQHVRGRAGDHEQREVEQRQRERDLAQRRGVHGASFGRAEDRLDEVVLAPREIPERGGVEHDEHDDEDREIRRGEPRDYACNE